RLHTIVLALVIEPPGPDRDVRLRRHPPRAIPMPSFCLLVLRCPGCRNASIFEGVRVVRRPARLARDARFVAHPAHVGADVAEDDRARLELADEREGLVPLVVRLAVDASALAGPAVEAIAPIGAVEPDLAD